MPTESSGAAPGDDAQEPQNKRFPPDDPREWLNRARSNLAKADSAPGSPEIYLEDLCFDAQQAAEKAIKAILLHLNVRFPYVHDLAQLLSLVDQAGQDVPESIRVAGGLTEYAVETRYPGLSEPVTWEEYREAVFLARAVVRWAEAVITRPEHEQQELLAWAERIGDQYDDVFRRLAE